MSVANSNHFVCRSASKTKRIKYVMRDRCGVYCLSTTVLIIIVKVKGAFGLNVFLPWKHDLQCE